MNYFNYEESKKLFIYFLIIAFFIVCFLISPLLSFFLIIIFLILVKIEDFTLRAPLVIMAFVSGCLIYSSRVVGNVYGDDFANEYYPLYENLYKGHGIFDSEFGGGVEIGLSIYFKILTLILPHLSPSIVMFSVSMLCAVLLYIWIEVFFFKENIVENKTLLLASVLAFFGFFVTTQLMRQAISSVFILFAISYFNDKKILISGIFVIIGCIFHLTVLPFSLLYYILMYSSKKKKLIVLSSFFVFGVLFSVILSVIASSGLFFGIVSKFLYYLKNTQSGISTAYYWKILIPMIFLSFLFSKNNLKSLKSLLLYGLLCYLCIVSIPFASDRVFMLLNIYLLGGVVYMAFGKILNCYKVILILFCVFRFFSQGPFYDTECTNTALCLWGSYPWVGSLLR